MIKEQRGNLLFLILLAVFLFAALSYAVTKSVQGGGKNARSESAQAEASQMLQTATLFENELNRFLLIRGYTIDQIDLVSSAVEYGNGSTCTTDACNLLSPNGGNVKLGMLPLSFSDPLYTAYYPTYAANGGISWKTIKQRVVNAGTDLPDLVLVVFGVRADICAEINKMMSTGSDTGQYHWWVTADASATGDTFDVPNGARTWCHMQSNQYGPYFHHLLYAR